MIAWLWFKRTLQHRRGRLVGAMTGTAITVALLVSIEAFSAGSAASMTRRALASVPVDWQVVLTPGADPQRVEQAIHAATPTTALQHVGYADSPGFSAATGGTTQTTGAGKVLGVDPEYRQQFSSEFRLLQGTSDGVLVAQQTAANLHVSVGDQVTIQRQGLDPVSVHVAGVAELPQADSLFQAVGVPAGTAPQAPPDNVLIVPANQWHQLFDPQAAVRPDGVRTQLHVRLDQHLPPDPSAAYIAVQQLARNVEARIAGSGIIGDNIAARLGGARADALYARVLFLFLGLPGAVLAVLLTFAVAASGAARRRTEQALLRVRGATTAQLLRLQFTEAVMVGASGVVIGVVSAVVLTSTVLTLGYLFANPQALVLISLTALLGFALAISAIVYPAWQQARHSTVITARAAIGQPRIPLWQRVYLDVLLLVLAALVFWRSAASGYQLVLAPEGVPQTSVSYELFLAPLALWLGVALLSLRLWRSGLLHGRRALARTLRPVAHGLSPVVAASLGRQRHAITRGMVLVALAFSFATSTAVFNTTYNAQSRVDAELTNGADVQVTGPTLTAPSSKLAALQALPGVVAVQPMQHRFAYVGADLQDLYGIDPAKIGTVTNIANAYFANHDAQRTLAALTAQPDGLFVSAETATDFQLKLGDQINLRLQSAHDQHYHVVPFRFLGIAREFPTAPKDSFLVANASYIARQTGTNAAEIVLLRTAGNVGAVADQTRRVVANLAGAKVSDISTAQRTISSSLTAVDLRSLTQLELAFAIVLLAGATGLVLALGLAERRRTFAILAALGARPSQLGAFLWSEGLLILIGGGVIGIATGFGVAYMLVRVLTGVFDPPPEAVAVPWIYLGMLLAAALVSTVLAVLGARRASTQPTITALRGT